jgi:hypothetical protein
MRSISPRSFSLRTTGRPTARPYPIPRAPASALGMRRTFILHASGSKLPSDLLGLTCVRYGETTTATEMRIVNQKLRKAIENEGRIARIEGLWWRSWQQDGTLSARYWSEAAKERREPPGVFYYWKGERPRHPNAPQLEGTGEIHIESADRAAGYFTTRSDTHPKVKERTSGVYLRADPEQMSILDGRDDRKRAELIAEPPHPRFRDAAIAATALQTSRAAVSAASPVVSRDGMNTTRSNPTIRHFAARPRSSSSTCQ